MQVLVLGGTGSIGAPVVADLVRHGHDVTGLARSDRSASLLAGMAAKALSGDIRKPADWAGAVLDTDAVVDVSGTFTEDEGEVSAALFTALTRESEKRDKSLRLLMTGGCWLYGATGDAVATEATPFDCLEPFRWSIDLWHGVTERDCFHASILHPAMVYDRDGGVFSRFIEPARHGRPIEIWGSPDTRWPLVHRADNASAYRLVLQGGRGGRMYNVAAEDGVRVGRIAEVIARRFGVDVSPNVKSVQDLVAEHGSWAEGPTIDQQMSGGRLRGELGWAPQHEDALALVA